MTAPLVFRNNKTGSHYTFLGFVTDATNEAEGRTMVHYQDESGKQYVRDAREFEQKFTPEEVR